MFRAEGRCKLRELMFVVSVVVTDRLSQGDVLGVLKSILLSSGSCGSDSDPARLSSLGRFSGDRGRVSLGVGRIKACRDAWLRPEADMG